MSAPGRFSGDESSDPAPPAPPARQERPSDSLVASEEVAGRGPGSVLEYGPPAAPAFLRGFRALRHRDFRLFYTGQLISLVGTWMQSLAQSWLVLVLTGSALALGVVGALQFLPVLFLSALGGMAADRLPKRWVLVGTQAVEMILAFTLALLTFTGVVSYVDVLILALLLGIANAIDMPTRQAFVVELVGPEDLTNAIALNSTVFNAARLVGPALAGLLIGIIGISGCFLLNGLSFLAVIAGLLIMNPMHRPARHLESLREIVQDLREGFRYVRLNQLVRAVIVIVGAVGTFGANFNVVLPIFARDTLGVGATGLGWLMASMGLGSLVASLALAYGGGRPSERTIVLAAVAFSIFEMALAPVSSFAVSLGLLTMIGAMMVMVSAVANSFLQASVPHRLRGRVMSIYTTVFVGTTPIGNTVSGIIAESTGAFGPLLLGGLATLVTSVLVGTTLIRTPRRASVQRRERARYLDSSDRSRH